MRKSKADTVQGGVLAENQAKIDSYEKSIRAALERKRKVIIESKLYTYGQLSELYGGAEGQALLDAVTAEHTLIGKLTASGMSYADIEGLVDSPAMKVSDKDSSNTDNGYSHYADSEQLDGQTSLFG
ncbi:hypothetical protein [Ruminococcus albus]|uniref:Uncharacterized protein n=1 Tax=Ruminococcus albus TaxID=1264 RepID=A0A1I1JTC3_RUMAL|nr:hypothetical protein [Ruminococcus albus]SFC51615.1 hypothetical protein SAMN02910406_01856 [Ruminococcus albus]